MEKSAGQKTVLNASNSVTQLQHIQHIDNSAALSFTLFLWTTLVV